MARETKNEDRKQRIRDAFQEGQAVERMPAREDMQPQNSEDVELRVAPYCRVSTMSEMQAESFEIQQQYYSECIAKHPNWVLVRIYADEGISATSVKNRKEFNQMIEDCQAGKIDMIITKSVSRFARNVVDCIKYARMLDLFAHKRVRNLGQAERFRVRDAHTPLVSKEDWREVKNRVSMPDREAVILEDITGEGVLAELHPIQFKEDVDI